MTQPGIAAPPLLTQREIALFFLPMLLNVQLMSISHSIINAFLARSAEQIVALAAFSVAMVIHIFLASPSYQNHSVTIAMVRGRKSYRGTVIFVLVVASYVSLMLCLIAFTPIGDYLLQSFLGIDDVVTREAKRALGILAFLPFITGFRGFFQGLLMQQRRTALLSSATLIRVIALFVILGLGSQWLSGITLGAVGLFGCVTIETIIVGIIALRMPKPVALPDLDEKGAWEILRFGFHLAYASCFQQAIPLLISALLGRLPDATLALAAYGVLRGFLFLLAGPLRNLQQTYQSLVRRPEDFATMIRFHRWAGGLLALGILLIAFPLRTPVLGGLMGLDLEMRDYIAIPLACSALYPLLYGSTNVLRGYFTTQHRTFELGRSTVYKIVFLLAVWGIMLLFPVPVPGIAIAVFLLVASEFCENFYLIWRRRVLLRQELLPPERS
ncbi:MAG: hypothetical protein Q7U44_09860 [Desulfuromonadales bacterium]|nr:hypothetical protein [Desulfuromonadales bacterium]